MKPILPYATLSILLFIVGCGGPSTGPSDVVVSNPPQAVADARRMIEEKRKDPNIHKGWITPSHLPESLQLPGLRYAQVFDDHVNLVLARNPDWQIGARIWAADRTREHHDEKTKYTDIYFFDYTNDLGESPDNIR